MVNIFVLIIAVLWIFSLTILVWQISNIISVIFGCLYVGTGNRIIKKALKLAQLKKGEVFYDLGCGKADSLVIANSFGAKATGFEISPYYYIWSKIRALPHLNIAVKYRNLKNVDLGKADVVYCYLLPEFLEKLSPKFKYELKKSARLISISFKVPGLRLLKKETFKNKTIYIYSR